MDEADVRRAVKMYVWTGFYEAEEIEEIVGEEMFEPGEVDPDALRSMVAEEFAAKRAAEATWPAETDCDRLDRVFERLDAEGIIALQNAGMTQSDGLEDVTQVYHESGGDASSRYRGYCFYHGQDLERVVNGGELALAFGHVEGDDRAKDTAVGHEIKAALEAAGFAVRWPGDARTRLAVTGMKWQRRRGPA